MTVLLRYHLPVNPMRSDESGILSSKVIQTLSPQELLKMMPAMFGEAALADKAMKTDGQIVDVYQELSTDTYNDFRTEQVLRGSSYEYVMVPQAYLHEDEAFQNSLIQHTIDFFTEAKEKGENISLFILAAEEDDMNPVVKTVQVLQNNNVPFRVKMHQGKAKDLPDFALVDNTVFKVENYQGKPLVVESDPSDFSEFHDVLLSSNFTDIDTGDLTGATE